MKRGRLALLLLLSGCVSIVISLWVSAAPGWAQEVAPRAAGYFKRALQCNHEGDYARALEYFLMAYREDASVLALDDGGLLDNAESYLRKKLSENPEDVSMMFRLAELLYMRDSLEESLSWYEKVVKLASDTPQASLARRKIERIREELQERKRLMEAAVASAPPSPSRADGGDGGDDDSSGGKDWKALYTAQLEKTRRLEMELEELKRQRDSLQKHVEELQKELKRLRGEYTTLQRKSRFWKKYYKRYRNDPLGRFKSN